MGSCGFVKITIAFFGVSSLVLVVLALFLYRFVERKLESELRDRLRNLTHVGSHAIDIPTYQTLLGKLGELDETAVSAAEHTDEYKRIYEQLRMIRGAEPDIAGFTVLESTGVPGRIHVSEATYTLIKDEFDFEQRPPIEVKGKGLMTTYLLSGIKPRDPARSSLPKLA